MENFIVVPKGIRYVSDWKDYSLQDFPFRHILDKKIPGCGYTEYCITCDIPIILCSPRKILLENKEMQHPDSVLYFKNELDEDSCVDKDISKPTRSTYVPEEISEEIRQKILENLQKDLEDYMLLCLTQKRTPKILVTYDSFRLVKQFLGEERMKWFNVVVDEWQSIFVDSRFKSSTEIEFLDQLKDIEKVCFVSATPMIEDYLKQLEEFKDMPYYEFDWASEDPLRIVSPDLKARVTKSIQSAAEKIISEYHSGNFKAAMTKDGVIYSKEAVFYVNSVTNIISIIKKCGLKPDECNILCANTIQNVKKIKARLGRKFTIGKVPLRGEPHKMFTFCTRTVYLGADFYSTNARTFIFSDANVDCLSVDITLDLPQILGRQRLNENPWKNRAELYYKTLGSGKALEKKDFDNIVKKKIKKTEDLLLAFQDVREEAKNLVAEKYLSDIKLSNYKGDYISVNRHGGNDMYPVFNNLVLIAEQRSFDIQQIDYKDRFSVFNTLSSNGMLGQDVPSQVNKFLLDFNNLDGFYNRMKLLCNSPELSEAELSVILDQVPLVYKNYYTVVGPDRIRALGYNQTDIAKEVNNLNIHGSGEIEKVVYREFEVGKRYTKFYIKEKLGEIYKDLNFSKTPKASDIEDYFATSPCLVSNKETGKRDAGFELLKKKN